MRAIFASLFLFANSVFAATWPSDGTPQSVQYLHDNSAQNGDTITLPSGTFTWTSGVLISKGITLQGSGATSTIINDNCQNVKLLGITLVANQLTRITGITFQDAGRTGSSFAISVDGSNTDAGKYRFDHNTYKNIAGLYVLNTVIGVIDHNTWTQPGHAGFYIYDSRWNGGGVGKGDESWADATNFGGSQFLFIEDNNFIGTSPTEVLPLTDAYYGARFVIRHNTIRDMYVANHGTESSGRIRGGRALEVYNNTFLGSGINRYIVGIRSGAMIVHDNTITGYWGGSTTIAFTNYRNLAPFPPWDLGLSAVDGTSQWDNNDPTIYFTGTAASSVPDTVTVSGSPNWALNQWVDYVLRRTTNNGGSGSVTYGWIVSNTANTITYRGTAGFRGLADMTFAPGDSLEIRKVNSALDQPGRARGSLITNDPTPTLPWPAGQNDQVTEPIYLWNNIVTETGQNVNLIENGSGGARQGIHWFNGVPMPGYTPYAYPHPLVTGGPTPTPAPSPTASPIPTATATATQIPSATPTAPATATPISSATPINTATPSATSTPSGTPNPVECLSISLVGCNKTDLNWCYCCSVPPVSFFIIERGTDNVQFTQIAQVDPWTRFYEDTTAPGGLNYYRFSAVNGAGRSAYSYISATQPGCGSSPTPTATATPAATPTATATTSPPIQCSVPNFIGHRISEARLMWTQAGFVGVNLTTNGGSGQTIRSQSLPPGSFGSCGTAVVRVSK